MATAQTETTPATDAPATVTVELALEHAKRAFALKKYEQAVDHYATALELITEQHGEDAPETADLYFLYGKALLENAISQNSVLGKEQGDEGLDPEDKASGSGSHGNGPILSFSGDAEDVEDGSDDRTVDLFAEAAQNVAEAEALEGDDDDDDDAEPEDDFNASWEVLDLARAIYDKQKDGDEEVKLKLADTYIALGDVSLETEKFDQAITDYEEGLALKLELLPVSSRQIAEAHYKLSMVLDLTSGRLSDAISHAEKALESVESRLAELRQGKSSKLSSQSVDQEKEDIKGKGKSTGTRLVRDDLVESMTIAQIEAELKELSELKEDLALKVEELKTSPSESVETTAPALVAQALDKELNAGSSSSKVSGAINDLTSMVVKKKKKIPQDGTAEKRKADNEVTAPNSEKKPKLETTDP